MLAPIARLLLKLGRWQVADTAPPVDRAVLIAAPHTSNWDGYWAIVFLIATRLRVRFFAKQSLFWFPLGNILSALGGIPLDRSRAGGAVQQAVDLFAGRDKLIFGLAPEGTRRYTETWRSGFYRMASDAEVPLVLAYFDYARRRIGIGPVYRLTGDPAIDLSYLGEFYAEHGSGRHPERVGPVAFSKRLS